VNIYGKISSITIVLKQSDESQVNDYCNKKQLEDLGISLRNYLSLLSVYFWFLEKTKTYIIGLT
jgi:hypothetical protein|tara:strand:- start:321 stop:512 length:192 start_codon:yes stop_codon:yes gene_type:complete